MSKHLFWRILLLVFAGLLGLGQLQRISNTPFFLHEVVMVLCILFSLQEGVRYIKDITNNQVIRVCALFLLYVLAVTCLQLLWSPLSSFLVGLLYWFRLVLYALFALHVWIVLRAKVLQKQEVISLAVLTTTLITIAGFVQFFFFPDLRILRFAGWDDHYLRLASTLLDPSFTGIMLFLGSTVLLHKIVTRYTHQALFLFGITLVAVFLTYSRGTYLAYVVWGIVLALYKPALRKILWWILGACVIVLLVLPRPASEGTRLERMTSIRARLVNMETTLGSMTTRDWLVGKGWYMAMAERELNNTITTISHSSSPDNSFLHVLQSLGVVGLGFFMYMLFAIWKRITVYGRAVLLAVSVASCFSQLLFYPFVMAFFPYVLYIYRKS